MHSGSPATVQIFRQSSPLRFQLAGTSVGWPSSGHMIRSADVDHDGRPDLLAAGKLPGFSWARNRGTEGSPPAD